jgi:hypothetical protein
METEKEFYITSTINIMAKSRDEACERISVEMKTTTGLGWDLLDNAEVDEA